LGQVGREGMKVRALTGKSSIVRAYF